LGAAMTPVAKKFVSVQDNLNTYNPSSFYENLRQAAAYALAQKFELYYTPVKGEWLNLANLESSCRADPASVCGGA
jgi:hypothetical protein